MQDNLYNWTKYLVAKQIKTESLNKDGCSEALRYIECIANIT